MSWPGFCSTLFINGDGKPAETVFKKLYDLHMQKEFSGLVLTSAMA
jgi:hypothetical protein